MALKTAEAEIITANINKKPLLYLVDNDRINGNQDRQVIYNNSGVFYILIIAVLFCCFGFILNIGLRVQNINYQKNLYKMDQLISLEEERAERLKLEIASLTSPSRIIEIAQNDLGMEISEKHQLLKISGEGIKNNEKILSYISKESEDSIFKNYDNLLGTIYYVQNIIMVVSESVLTFFIP